MCDSTSRSRCSSSRWRPVSSCSPFPVSDGSRLHQSIPSSFALSAEAIKSRSLIVSSSMSSRLIATSPATTIPLSRTRSNTSASDEPDDGVIARFGESSYQSAPSLELICLAPHISTGAFVTLEVAARVELHLIGREHVGGRRDAFELDDLDRHPPPVVLAREPGHRVGPAPHHRGQLLGGPADQRARIGPAFAIRGADPALSLLVRHHDTSKRWSSDS